AQPRAQPAAPGAAFRSARRLRQAASARVRRRYRPESSARTVAAAGRATAQPELPLPDRGPPRSPAQAMSEEVPIRGETIRLGQLLKLAGIVDSGGEARELLETQPVLVNGTPETRRGRQLHPGDEVQLGGHALRVTAER